MNNHYLYGLGFFENVFDYEEPTQLSNHLFSQFYISHDTVFAIDLIGQVYILGRNKTLLNLNQKRDFHLNKLTLVPGLNDIVEISIGGDHILFLNKYGEVFASGENRYGQLGFPKDRKDYPLIKLNFKNIVHIYATYNTSYMIDHDMKLYGFGSNNNYILGLEDEELDSEPIVLLNQIIQVTGTGSLTLALDINGDLHLLGKYDPDDPAVRKLDLNLFL